MRAHLRAILESLKQHALEWAVTAALATLLPPMLALEEQFLTWIRQEHPTWEFRAWIVLIVAIWWVWIRWEWHRPRLRFDPESGAYINRKDGFHYCTQCRKEGHLVALREAKTAWRCFGCGAFYPKLKQV